MDAPTPPPSPDDAARWLAAAAARIEDDPALLDALSDEDVARLLAAESARPAAVAAAIRRRVRDAERAPERAPRMRLVRWPAVASGVLALAAVVALWVLRPSAPDAEALVATYRTELATLAAAGPRIKGGAERAEAARLLAEAAAATPPDTAAARRAADLFAAEADGSGQSAFFAALAYDLAGDDAAAARWVAEVPDDSPYAADARALR